MSPRALTEDRHLKGTEPKRCFFAPRKFTLGAHYEKLWESTPKGQLSHHTNKTNMRDTCNGHARKDTKCRTH